MRYYELTREARTEFGRVVVQSLLGSAELEAAGRHDRLGFRRRRVERRIGELRAALAVLSPVAPPHAARRGWAWPFRLVTGAWLVTFTLTVAYVAARGINGGTGAFDVALLLMTVLWTWVWVAAAPEGAETAVETDASALEAHGEESDDSTRDVVALITPWLEH